MQDQHIAHLRGLLSRGDLVLFTGAGFSAGATSISGRKVPSVEELRQALWAIAFPGEAIDDRSNLGDVYEVAVTRHRNQTGQTIGRLLRVDANSLPDAYRL